MKEETKETKPTRTVTLSQVMDKWDIIQRVAEHTRKQFDSGEVVCIIADDDVAMLNSMVQHCRASFERSLNRLLETDGALDDILADLSK